MRRIGVIAIRLALALLLVVLSLGFTYQLVARARDLRRNPAPGQMVDIGGYRLHIHCTGHGSPTVILEAGGANGSLSWYQVQPLIARFTRVCAYDRAGHGWSDSIPKSRLPSEIAEELHVLLARLELMALTWLSGTLLAGSTPGCSRPGFGIKSLALFSWIPAILISINACQRVCKRWKEAVNGK